MKHTGAFGSTIPEPFHMFQGEQKYKVIGGNSWPVLPQSLVFSSAVSSKWKERATAFARRPDFGAVLVYA